MSGDIYTKIRAYGLASLHITLSLLALLLTIAAFKLWPFINHGIHTLTVFATVVSGIISAFSNGRAASRIIRALGYKHPVPATEFTPFLLISVCMILSSWLLFSIES